MKRRSLIALGLALVLGCSVLGGCAKEKADPVEREKIEESADEEQEEEKEQEEEIPDDGKFLSLIHI